MRQIKEFLDEFFGLEIIPEPQRHSAPVCISITSDIPHEAARSLIVKGLIQLGVWMKEAGE